MKWSHILTAAIFCSASHAYARELRSISDTMDSTVSFEETSQLTPISYLETGSYGSRDGYFGGLHIQEWANDYVLTGYLSYQGVRVPFEAEVTSQRGNLFEGRGHITVTYTDGVRCSYSMEFSIDAYLEGLFIRSNIPTSIVIDKPYGAGCYRSGSYSNLRHPRPYIRKVP